MSVFKNAKGALKTRAGKKATLASRIGAFAVIVFVVYAVIVIISTEAEMKELEAVLDSLRNQITLAHQENDEYERLLSSEDKNAYMEMIAIEKLGYAYPNEKRFYIKEGSADNKAE